MSSPVDILRQWIELVTGFANDHVVYSKGEETSAPRPNLDDASPYVAMRLTGDDSPMSTPYERTTDEDAGDDKVWMYRSLQRAGELAMAFFGPGSADYARAVELSLGRPDVIELFGDDLNVVMAGGVGDQPILRSTKREPAATLGFVVEWTDSEKFAVLPTEGIETDLEGLTP